MYSTRDDVRPARGFSSRVNEAMSNFDLVAEEKIERERMTRNAQYLEARTRIG
jgi:hypothetical protein